MPNQSYLIISSFSIISGCILFFKSLAHKGRIARSLSFFIFSSILVILFYTLATFIKSQLIAKIFFSFYFFSTTIAIFALFMFSKEYVNVTFKKWFFVILFAILFIDFVSMFLNIPLSHVASVVYIDYGSTYKFAGWVFLPKTYFYPHIFFWYFLGACFVLLSVYRFINSSISYRIKYYSLLFFTLIITVSNLLFLFQNTIFDFISIIYVIESFILYIFTYKINPTLLNFRMNQRFLSSIDSVVFLFDNDGLYQYSNDAGNNMILSHPEFKSFSRLCEYFNITYRDGEKAEVFVTENGNKIFYQCECQTLSDKKGRFEGNYVIITDVTKKHLENEIREYQISHDTLTGLYNRSAFYERAETILLKNPEVDFSMISTNIRQFKIINSVLGRKTGDILLKKIADILMNFPYENVLCGRITADKFAILAPSKYNLEKIIEPMISGALLTFKEENSLKVEISNCYGIVKIANYSNSAADIIDMTSLAILSISDNVAINMAYYNSEMRDKIIWENQLLSDFTDALHTEQFLIFYHPQYDSYSGKIVGAEALVRWKHPKYGLIPPSDFIPLFERAGVIFQLDRYVWNHAAQDLKQIVSKGFELAISVNISPRDAYSIDIVSVFDEIIARYDVPPSLLKLEITETAAALNMKEFVSTLVELQKHGFCIEMDDFGSGYSSLNSLKSIPINILKMDMHFLDDCNNSEVSEKIMKTVVDLSLSLGVPLIAEGVETEKQVDLLKKIGCRYVQGFYFLQPLPFDGFVQELSKNEIGELA